MLRWIANLIAVVLLAGGAGAGALWWRSYRVQDSVVRYRADGSDAYFARRGALVYFALRDPTPLDRGTEGEWRRASAELTPTGVNVIDKPEKSVMGFGMGASAADGYRFVTAPCWAAVAALGLVPAVRLAWVVVRRKRRRAGACAQCGYDLRASVGRCPECGTAIEGGER